MPNNPPPSAQPTQPEPRSWQLAGKFFWRALRLRCPECGISPIFPPLTRIRKPADLFTPLDGCPRCGYPYTREVGSFLMATWAVSYGFGSLIGLAIYLYMEYVLNASLKAMLWTCISAVLIVNLLLARHARSFWLAFDHFCDPHVREAADEGRDDGRGGGNVRRDLPPPDAPRGVSQIPPVRSVAAEASEVVVAGAVRPAEKVGSPAD
jgi:uncharacterized protein (DUF983 family)